MPYEIILHGRVQNVGCRYYCAEVARKLGISGAAANLRDGSVRVIADTDDIAIAQRYAHALKENSLGVHFYGHIESADISETNRNVEGDYEW